MRPDDLLHPTPKGLYCPPGDFYIDPVQPVETALITHGHADHARAGHDTVFATQQTLDIMAIRYGADHCTAPHAVDLRETFSLNGVTVGFYPAGHVLGSAQILVEFDGTRIVASGDYKRRKDPTCEPFEPVACDVFITEATFALPVFRHPNDRAEIDKLIASVRQFPESAHLVGVYALGKAQRVISLIRGAGHNAPIYIHGSLAKLCDYYESQGIDLGVLEPATVANSKKGDFAGAIVLGPPSAFTDKWARRFPDPITCFCSGWMQVRQRAKQRGVELPIILSDHCDWDELLDTILEVAPKEVWVTHGRDDALVRWCTMNNIKARPLHLVGYEDENE
ncbi:ligase-associated DNA damage response exonuclease [Pseudahrensia aquimaris]|uniref:Ligase-associated DNA damage response exonuclease n=1 Tax=Pseudahrensia aquimaris TaxID=744461 RepID=A0ABW3FFT0_9HYPH